MTVFCNKNSSTDAGTWIEVQTGQSLKTLNCTRVCRELLPPVGTKQISQTCAQAALYNLACKKDFSCIEGEWDRKAEKQRASIQTEVALQRQHPVPEHLQRTQLSVEQSTVKQDG